MNAGSSLGVGEAASIRVIVEIRSPPLRQRIFKDGYALQSQFPVLLLRYCVRPAA